MEYTLDHLKYRQATNFESRLLLKAYEDSSVNKVSPYIAYGIATFCFFGVIQGLVRKDDIKQIALILAIGIAFIIGASILKTWPAKEAKDALSQKYEITGAQCIWCDTELYTSGVHSHNSTFSRYKVRLTTENGEETDIIIEDAGSVKEGDKADFYSSATDIVHSVANIIKNRTDNDTDDKYFLGRKCYIVHYKEDDRYALIFYDDSDVAL